MSSACKPYSPKATELPRWATPFIFPRWLLRNFTRLGIIGIRHRIFQTNRGPAAHPLHTSNLPSSATRAATGSHIRLQNFFTVHSAIDPGLHADRAVRREGNCVAVVDVRLKRGQGNRALAGLFL